MGGRGEGGSGCSLAAFMGMMMSIANSISVPLHSIWQQTPGGPARCRTVFCRLPLQVRNIMDLMYAYTKRMEPTVPIVCCDAQCEERLWWLTTVHLRGLHFKVGPLACYLLLAW